MPPHSGQQIAVCGADDPHVHPPGALTDYVYTTTGNGTSFENSRAFGAAIAKALKQDNVQG
ncbi:MAG: glycine/sarcosine/betaine reductase selenoprotein B family protein [Desulfovibrio fairfieldensis]|nr:glycine/sarcosine/betaine reductase selenoprotein B family protein [Desulfovibrio fairfieldensis]